MSRATVKIDRVAAELSDIILAEWYRVLPPKPPIGTTPPAPLAMDANALTGAFNQILEQQCEVILDIKDKPIRIVVPLPPKDIDTREDLVAYIKRNSDFRQGMAMAMLFGCGR